MTTKAKRKRYSVLFKQNNSSRVTINPSFVTLADFGRSHFLDNGTSDKISAIGNPGLIVQNVNKHIIVLYNSL